MDYAHQPQHLKLCRLILFRMKVVYVERRKRSKFFTCQATSYGYDKSSQNDSVPHVDPTRKYKVHCLVLGGLRSALRVLILRQFRSDDDGLALPTAEDNRIFNTM